MKDNLLCLSAARQGDLLHIGLYNSRAAVQPCESVSLPMNRVEARCRELTEMLNRIIREGRENQGAVEQLRRQGRSLCRELLPGTVRQKLAQSRAEYLILHLDLSLLHIPWEILCPEEDFLCQRFCTGRRVNLSGNAWVSDECCLSRPIRMWIIANPKGDLAVADAEGEGIFREADLLNQEGEVIEPVLDSSVSPEEIREGIRHYDLLHFAGHVRHDLHHPENSGWELMGGSFTAADIDRLAGGMPMPSFVFSNACQSARTREMNSHWEGFIGSGGPAEAFLRAGVHHYLGTAWEIPDPAGRQFALHFYRHLLAGKTMGQAVRESREDVTRENPHISGFAYVLYGDPCVRYFARTPGMRHGESQNAETKPVREEKNLCPDSSLIRKKMHNPGVWLFVMILVLSLVSGTFIMQKNKARAQHILRQELMARADQNQNRTERLIKELADLAADIPVPEKAAKDSPSLAMVFDSHFAAGEKEKMILFAIQNRVLESQSFFRLLERQSFDRVLEEIIRTRRLYPKENQYPLKLILPELLVILEVSSTDADPLVLMRVTDTETGMLTANLFETLDANQPVLAQKEKLAAPLLNILKKMENGSVQSFAD